MSRASKTLPRVSRLPEPRSGRELWGLAASAKPSQLRDPVSSGSEDLSMERRMSRNSSALPRVSRLPEPSQQFDPASSDSEDLAAQRRASRRHARGLPGVSRLPEPGREFPLEQPSEEQPSEEQQSPLQRLPQKEQWKELEQEGEKSVQEEEEQEATLLPSAASFAQELLQSGLDAVYRPGTGEGAGEGATHLALTEDASSLIIGTAPVLATLQNPCCLSSLRAQSPRALSPRAQSPRAQSPKAASSAPWIKAGEKAIALKAEPLPKEGSNSSGDSIAPSPLTASPDGRHVVRI